MLLYLGHKCFNLIHRRSKSNWGCSKLFAFHNLLPRARELGFIYERNSTRYYIFLYKRDIGEGSFILSHSLLRCHKGSNMRILICKANSFSTGLDHVNSYCL